MYCSKVLFFGLQLVVNLSCVLPCNTVLFAAFFLNSTSSGGKSQFFACRRKCPRVLSVTGTVTVFPSASLYDNAASCGLNFVLSRSLTSARKLVVSVTSSGAVLRNNRCAN